MYKFDIKSPFANPRSTALGLAVAAAAFGMAPQQAQGERPAVPRDLTASTPRLLATTIRWSPALPVELSQRWGDAPTLMAGHAKLLALYPTPF